jgi:tetratricopeptide (TPR) repeat protein
MPKQVIFSTFLIFFWTTVPATQIAMALKPEAVSDISEQVVVAIKSNSSSGSGVIIKKNKDEYSVLTAAHVVNSAQRLPQEIITVDKRRYLIDAQRIKISPQNLDLAIVTFRSDRVYQVATIGDSSKVKRGQIIFVAGFPVRDVGLIGNVKAQEPTLFFKTGNVVAISSKPRANGYALVYNNANTLPGMSGGAVLNEDGMLIGIHGKGDIDVGYQDSQENSSIRYKTGNDLAIPINLFAGVADKMGVVLGVQLANSLSTKDTPDDFFLSGLDKQSQGNDRGAITDLDRAIALDPNYTYAYYIRGAAHSNLGNTRQAISDFNRSISPRSGDLTSLLAQGFISNNRREYQNAMGYYTKALQINPNSWFAYNNRGAAKISIDDYQGAIQDLKTGIKLYPNFAMAYANLGYVYFLSNNHQLALENLNRALAINPDFDLARYSRGLVYLKKCQ